MIYTVQNLVRKIRQETNQDPEYEGAVSNTEMGMYIDDAQDAIADQILNKSPLLLSHYFDLTLTGAREYYIPDHIPFDYETILMVEDVTASDSPHRTHYTMWGDRMNFRGRSTRTVYDVWNLRDQYIEFPEEPTSKTMRVWYTRRPVGLFYGTVAGGTASTITFPTYPTVGEVRLKDDYYIGMNVHCNSEIRRITDYVGSTRTATVDSVWSTTPTTSHTMSLISSLPQRFHQLIAMYAVRSIKVSEDDDDTLVARFIREEMANKTSKLQHNQRQQPERVRHIPR
jgi:hypothetical protein